METLAKLAMERVLQLEGRNGSLNIGQGVLKGFLNPTNLPTYKILVLDIGDGVETRILVNESIQEYMDKEDAEVELVQYVGLEDNDLGLIMSYDVVLFTSNSEIVFREG